MLNDESEHSRFWVAMGVLAALALVAFWIYVFANRGSIAHDDEFSDPEFSAAAELICAERQAAIAELPLATAAEGPLDRAPLVAAGTTELAAMLVELRELGLPATEAGAETLPQWLADYDTYLNDRRVWTEQLELGLDEPFLISGNDQGVRITDLLNTYAEVNFMRSCAPSGDA